jgi:glycosyltransferase involved in cell wall biosynthesis
MTQKIALVHDFLREYGGGERVLEALHEMYPDAPVYTAFLDKKALGKHWHRFKDWNIKTTWFDKIPFIKKLYSPLRFLVDKAFADLDLSEFDVVITSSNAFMAKAVKSKKQICYCHTPPRALYGYSTMSDWKKNKIIKFGGDLINHYMRVIDFKISQKVDVFVANSEETQKRIKKFYKRDSVVIYPPVTTGEDKTSQERGDYYLFVGRLGLQKHPELALKACENLGLKLKIAGTGQMLEDLKEMASENIEMLGAVSDQELNKLYAGAKALIYPAEDEDFGMIPVEAMSYGIPVIAHNSGGPKETVLQSRTGILFDDLSVDGLVEAIKKFEKTKFNSQEIIKSTEKFSKNNFQRKIRELVE